MLPVKDYAAEQRVGNHAPLHAAPQQPKQALGLNTQTQNDVRLVGTHRSVLTIRRRLLW